MLIVVPIKSYLLRWDTLHSGNIFSFHPPGHWFKNQYGLFLSIYFPLVIMKCSNCERKTEREREIEKERERDREREREKKKDSE